TQTILVLGVDVVEYKIDAGFAAQIVIAREHGLALVAETVRGCREYKVAADQTGHQRVVDHLVGGHVHRGNVVSSSGCHREQVRQRAAADHHPFQIRIRVEI